MLLWAPIVNAIYVQPSNIIVLWFYQKNCFKERLDGKNSFILSLKYLVHVSWKNKITINGTKNIKKNYSPVDKSLVGEGAGEEDVYQQYLGTLGGQNILYDEVSEKKKKISHINNSSTAVFREFDFVDGEILICVDLLPDI